MEVKILLWRFRKQTENTLILLRYLKNNSNYANLYNLIIILSIKNIRISIKKWYCHHVRFCLNTFNFIFKVQDFKSYPIIKQNFRDTIHFIHNFTLFSSNYTKLFTGYKISSLFMNYFCHSSNPFDDAFLITINITCKVCIKCT